MLGTWNSSSSLIGFPDCLDFAIPEVQQAVKEVWELWTPRVTGEVFNLDVLSAYATAKGLAFEAVVRVKAKLKSKQLAWQRKVQNKLEVFEGFAISQNLTGYRLQHLLKAERDFIELEAKETARMLLQSALMIRGLLLTILSVHTVRLMSRRR